MVAFLFLLVATTSFLVAVSPRLLDRVSDEGLRDGRLDEAWFAQPSGLATSADGRTVWVADSETSALRSVTTDDAGALVVTTHVGTGLFDFGHRDGAAADAVVEGDHLRHLGHLHAQRGDHADGGPDREPADDHAPVAEPVDQQRGDHRYRHAA